MMRAGTSIGSKDGKYTRRLPALFREISQHRVGGFGADDARQFLARGAPHAGEAPEGDKQGSPAARSNTRHAVQLRPEIAHASGLAMEADGESMRFVANLLHEPQRRIIFGKHDRVLAIAGIDELLLLGNADGNEVRQAELAERVVG